MHYFYHKETFKLVFKVFKHISKTRKLFSASLEASLKSSYFVLQFSLLRWSVTFLMETTPATREARMWSRKVWSLSRPTSFPEWWEILMRTKTWLSPQCPFSPPWPWSEKVTNVVCYELFWNRLLFLIIFGCVKFCFDNSDIS